MIVVLEIRANTAAIQAGSYQEAIQVLMSHNATLATNPELAQLVVTGVFDRDSDSLDTVEQFQLASISANIFHTFETAYLSHEYEIMNEREWARWPPMICNVYEQYWFVSGIVPCSQHSFAERICIFGAVAFAERPKRTMTPVPLSYGLQGFG